MRADRLARLHAGVDRHAGELVRVIPLAAGGYVAGAVDPQRAPLDVLAMVTDVPKTIRASGGTSTSGHNAELRTATHTVTFTTTALPYAVRSCDRVQLLARGDLKLKVNSADPFGTGRTIVHLEVVKPR